MKTYITLMGENGKYKIIRQEEDTTPLSRKDVFYADVESGQLFKYFEEGKTKKEIAEIYGWGSGHFAQYLDRRKARLFYNVRDNLYEYLKLSGNEKTFLWMLEGYKEEKIIIKFFNTVIERIKSLEESK